MASSKEGSWLLKEEFEKGRLRNWYVLLTKDAGRCCVAERGRIWDLGGLVSYQSVESHRDAGDLEGRKIACHLMSET
jgi:hypothetical protein